MGAILAACVFAWTEPVSAGSASCDRTCLLGALEAFLDRATIQDFDAIPLARGANVRENTVATPPAGGVWRSLVKVRAGYRFADPETGNVAFAGVVERRDGALTPLFVRLKVQGRTISEIETAWNTTPGRYFHPEELLEPDILYEAVVPPARRSSRAELIRIGGLYMDGIGAHSGKDVPLAYRCDKYYLGGKVTNSGANSVGDCLTSFDGIRASSPVGRRFPIVDVERGLVVVSFLMPNGYKPTPDSTYECEIIKVVDGKIRSVEEFGNSAAYPPQSGFDP